MTKKRKSKTKAKKRKTYHSTVTGRNKLLKPARKRVRKPSDLAPMADYAATVVTKDNLRSVYNGFRWTTLRAFKYTRPNGSSPVKPKHQPKLTCKKGAFLEVQEANTDYRATCAAGVNVGTEAWCRQEMRKGDKLWAVEFQGTDIACVPGGSNGNFRLYRGTVVGRVK